MNKDPKINKMGNDVLKRRIEELSRDDYEGRFITNETVQMIMEAKFRGFVIPENIQKYVKGI